MKTLNTVLFTTSLVALGCSGQSAQGTSTPKAANPQVTAPAPVTLGPTVADTGTIRTPALVSAGMTQIQAFVPTQPGATYLWSVGNGTLPGVATNAAVYYNAPASGVVALACTVTLAGVATTTTQTVPVVPVMPVTPFFYGSGFSADSLANTVVGGPSANVVSYRFQAKHTTPLEGFRIFFIWSSTKSGYNAGLGGTVRVDLLADDGTGAHLPTGPALASTSYGNIIPQNNFYPKLTFPNPVALTGGGLYHLVFTNIDQDPVANYISLDTLYTNAQTAPMQPVTSDATFAVLFKPAGGAWRVRQGYTPTLELDYTTGSQGNGYMEVWSTNPKSISGAASVRETFKVTGPSRDFSKVNVRLSRTSGSGPLTVRVEEADGTLVDQAALPAALFPQGVPTWVTATFPLSHVLNTGVAYNLVLACAADTSFSAFPMRKGRDKGFANTTFFPDGYAQFTTTGATGWQGWDMWGTPNLTFSDLQFAFVP
ncbi:hypothetical protein [Geothrix sp. 21YS21S-2]|uniref:hypothetical protein n=1 Tax=Geothrix sp. 21YS21S-2 TaxID=3068893 RepID=UPI0027B8D7F9|nr:hypothetical protein [Geothrix sp. 21YS21S-2]